MTMNNVSDSDLIEIAQKAVENHNENLDSLEDNDIAYFFILGQREECSEDGYAVFSLGIDFPFTIFDNQEFSLIIDKSNGISKIVSYPYEARKLMLFPSIMMKSVGD